MNNKTLSLVCVVLSSVSAIMGDIQWALLGMLFAIYWLLYDKK